MKPNIASSKQILSFCNEIGPDDGVDPRVVYRNPPHKRLNRKALQMCSEIARTVQAVLDYESSDDVLRTLTVESVQPAPNSTRVLVTVSVAPTAQIVDAGQILARLTLARGRLRAEVAAAIHRKRVPDLIFRVLVSGGLEA